MAPKQSILIVSAASVALGIALLVTSSLAVDLTRPYVKYCVGSLCTPYNYWIAAGSFGIIASLIQIASFGLAWIGKPKLWCICHLVICVMSITSFAIAVDHSGLKKGQADKIKVFTVFCLIDMIFAPAAAAGVYYLNR